jgi:alkylation response protein AidB-like acyl-CoA dehydrogenase
MAAALTLEQGSEVHYFRAQMRMMTNALKWARAKDEIGNVPLEDRSIRTRLAKVRARYEVASCFVARGIWAADTGASHRAWGPMAKMFVTDSALQSAWEILEISGGDGMMTGDHPLGVVELDHRRAYGMTIYGGANEIHRSIVAEQALGLPKSRS